MSTWTAVERIKITNIAFPHDAPAGPLLPALPSLRTLYLGQATLLRETAVAALVCAAAPPCLERVRLVDAYAESIWGRRIRRTDVERAAAALGLDEGGLAVALERIRVVVRCEVQNERVMGGDRAEGLVLLE